MLNAVRTVLQKPGWVPPYQPDTAFDFTRGTAWKGTGSGGGAVVAAESLLTVTRSSVAMIDDLKGQWREVPANMLARSGKGASIWEARTNLALWCRDWTNAAWAKVTMTAALTATGIDGTTNAATTITATGASSTILQTVTHVSSADAVSMFVRRRTGTGTIEVTGDGVAFTNITSALATAATATPGGWYRAEVDATLVNPVIGVRITTSGDAVDVDFAMLEVATFAGPPILTTTASVASAASQVSARITAKYGNSVTLYGEGIPAAPLAYATAQFLVTVLGADATNRLALLKAATTGLMAGNVNANNINLLNGGAAAWNPVVSAKGIVAYEVGRQATVNSIPTVALATASSSTAFSSPIIQANIGQNVASQYFNGYIKGIAIWPAYAAANLAMRDVVTG